MCNVLASFAQEEEPTEAAAVAMLIPLAATPAAGAAPAQNQPSAAKPMPQTTKTPTTTAGAVTRTPLTRSTAAKPGGQSAAGKTPGGAESIAPETADIAAGQTPVTSAAPAVAAGSALGLASVAGGRHSIAGIALLSSTFLSISLINGQIPEWVYHPRHSPTFHICRAGQEQRPPMPQEYFCTIMGSLCSLARYVPESLSCSGEIYS